MSVNHKKVSIHPTHKCSFCDKNNEEVRSMVAGPGVCICSECVLLCVKIIFDHHRDSEVKNESGA